MSDFEVFEGVEVLLPEPGEYFVLPQNLAVKVNSDVHSCMNKILYKGGTGESRFVFTNQYGVPWHSGSLENAFQKSGDLQFYRNNGLNGPKYVKRKAEEFGYAIQNLCEV